ncbi:Bro-N domain-containing protein [Burkholderia ubonensis]|nr:Bro-N domain-containing protein [Burkholderia ubonensis]
MNLRVVEIDGAPWFVAKDVCDALGIANSRDAMSALDGDERNTVAFSDGKRGNPNKTVISESGLYALIVRSNKPEARAFRKWVTSEVLPSIRKHGMYMTQEVAREAVEDPMSLMARALVVANEQLGVKTKQAYGLDPASDQEGPPIKTT